MSAVMRTTPSLRCPYLRLNQIHNTLQNDISAEDLSSQSILNGVIFSNNHTVMRVSRGYLVCDHSIYPFDIAKKRKFLV
uniref:Uncharacterized protein n=1 Tax=Anguilla anguilla TaxID=7936 RepID=A0A0E9S3V3_ANGAN